MRNLTEVLDKMLEEIPDGASNSLKDKLEHHRYNSFYQPPESSREWQKVSLTLHNEFGKEPPTVGWQKKICDIWMDRT